MRRMFFGILLMLIALPAFAGTLASNVRYTIEKALINEREAAARYDVFAAKAEEEGYPGAAALFRAQARAERVHAARFEKLLREDGASIPSESATKVTPGDTGDNLRLAATAETAERDGIYHEAIETARTHGADAIAKVFDETRDSEVEHANLCLTAARNLGAMKEAKTFYVCPRCGYTTDIALPLCASCRSREEHETFK